MTRSDGIPTLTYPSNVVYLATYRPVPVLTYEQAAEQARHAEQRAFIAETFAALRPGGGK